MVAATAVQSKRVCGTLILLTASLFLLAFLAMRSLASKGAEAPVTTDTLYGVWEAISHRNLGVALFRMDLTQHGSSFLAIAFLHGSADTLKLHSVDTRDGSLFISFGSEGNRSWALLEARGVASGDLARLTGAIRFSLDAGPEQVWPVEFLRLGGQFIERLCAASENAKRAIASARERHPSPRPMAAPTQGSLPPEKLRP